MSCVVPPPPVWEELSTANFIQLSCNKNVPIKEEGRPVRLRILMAERGISWQHKWQFHRQPHMEQFIYLSFSLIYINFEESYFWLLTYCLFNCILSLFLTIHLWMYPEWTMCSLNRTARVIALSILQNSYIKIVKSICQILNIYLRQTLIWAFRLKTIYQMRQQMAYFHWHQPFISILLNSYSLTNQNLTYLEPAVHNYTSQCSGLK